MILFIINMLLDQHHKYIHDNIHGYIQISNYADTIINSKEFQRLRKIKQLGTCVYVFPTATHTRFEHSIGTYHLADKLLTAIVKTTSPSEIENYMKNIPELTNYYKKTYNSNVHLLDEYVCELVKIAALCHDVGHGPFSHVFDDHFLPNSKKEKHINDSHEERSLALLKIIIKKNSVLSENISDDEIRFMQNLIVPKNNHTGFLYQIVSNNVNSLDVDKYDYIVRDSYMLGIKIGFDPTGLIDHVKIVNNNLSYPERLLYEIKRMFDARYFLHKQIYSHKSVISMQLMIIELFNVLDPVLKLSESIKNMDAYIKLTDEYVLTTVDHRLETYNNIKHLSTEFNDDYEKLLVAQKIINDISTHNLYKFIGYDVSDTKKNISIDNYRNVINFNQSLENDILIYQIKIGYVSGNKTNPLDNIYSHSSKLLATKTKLDKIEFSDISKIMPTSYQEYITMIFSKSKDNEIIKKITEYTEIVFKN